MRIIRNIGDYCKESEKIVLTIGKFDGVHLGHRRLIEAVLEHSQRIGGTAAALTFEPHPKKVLLPHERFELLTTPAQKIELLEKAGLSLLFIQRFTTRFSIRGPEEFVKDILVCKIKMNTLVFGTDFSFGRGATGDHRLMKNLGNRYGFKVVLIEPVMQSGRQVSSTRVRDVIRKGRMETAADFLGRLYYIDGKVIRGEGRGREMHIPTANILPKNELVPPQGVYATFLQVAGRIYNSVTNIGVRPTFGGRYLSIEANLIGEEIDLYGEKIRLHFVERLRGEKKFDSVKSLQCQIKNDIEKSLNILKKTSPKNFI